MMSFDKKGFTLTEVMLVMVISGIIVVATGQLLMTLQGKLKKSQQSSNRVLSLYRLTDRITDRTAYGGSLALSPDNDNLRVCMAGGPLGSCVTNCCVASISGAPASQEFALLDPEDPDNPPLLQNRRRLLGTLAKPAFYTAEGEPCSSGSVDSFYKVTGTFTPRCPAAAASCDKAEIMVLNLLIEPATASAQVKTRNLTLHFEPDNNAAPTVLAVANQTVQVGQKIKIPIYGNSGHPQEKQNLLFSTCKSSDAPAEFGAVACYGFMNDVGNIVIEGKKVGNLTVTFEVRDTGTNNNLSGPISFSVAVTP